MKENLYHDEKIRLNKIKSCNKRELLNHLHEYVKINLIHKIVNTAKKDKYFGHFVGQQEKVFTYSFSLRDRFRDLSLLLNQSMMLLRFFLASA